MNKWRPKDWKNPAAELLRAQGVDFNNESGGIMIIPHFKDNDKNKEINNLIQCAAQFEAGADAMLEAIEKEYNLQLVALYYDEMPIILRDGEQLLIVIKTEQGELPVFLTHFRLQGHYALCSLIITGEPVGLGALTH